ncbi:Uncharacterized protein APZ42_029666 [Daphnia magna]|uniref:Uncharacterized protein n=1 Tax=Daphnia magna TaxID=35525 RepID=A0A164PF19_9CRUS|nr:Uncharacterized protein APZ42_029666 [Daphnia magna]
MKQPTANTNEGVSLMVRVHAFQIDCGHN